MMSTNNIYDAAHVFTHGWAGWPDYLDLEPGEPVPTEEDVCREFDDYCDRDRIDVEYRAQIWVICASVLGIPDQVVLRIVA